MRQTKKKAVFLDRDGTIIYDVGYPKDPDQVRLLPGAAENLARLRKLGFELVIISNQSGIGRGFLTLEEVERVNGKVVALLEDQSAGIDATYYCPHAPEEQCICRKPSPQMLLSAAKDLNLELGLSFMIGDRPSDIDAGKRAGCTTVLLGSASAASDSDVSADFLAKDWSEVFSYIEKSTAASDNYGRRIGEQP